MSFEKFPNIRQWAIDRNLIEGATIKDQFAKTAEEFGEIGEGLADGNVDKIKDAIGDVVVTLVILAAQRGKELEDLLMQMRPELVSDSPEVSNAYFFATIALGELAAGVARGDQRRIEVAIIRLYYQLWAICEIMSLNIGECVGIAYNQIKDRKGRMVDGVFVKEGD